MYDEYLKKLKKQYPELNLQYIEQYYNQLETYQTSLEQELLFIQNYMMEVIMKNLVDPQILDTFFEMEYARIRKTYGNEALEEYLTKNGGKDERSIHSYPVL